MERWPQIKEILAAAIQRPADERAAFLAAACSDEALYREVESLLDSYESAFLEQPVVSQFVDRPSSVQPQVTAGQCISHYRIVSLLGRGGMGEVYLAEDTNLGRKVALKLLSASFAQDEARLRRFEQEACIASALNHPNILTIFEVEQVGSVHFIATELIDGQTLRQRIDSKTPGLHEALDIGIQVASALTAAHEAGIVHRDIKPENIILRRDGYVKVLDFGLAKLTADAVDPAASARVRVQTSAGLVMGTANYMSPEQARGEQVDARTDIWSLGVVLYEMVVGCGPFERSTPNEVIALILEREPPPLARYTREAPPELERIVSKTLTKVREERYQTAKELLVDLRGLKQRLEFEAEIERTVEPHEKSSDVKAVATGSEQGAAATARAIAVETRDAAIAQSTSKAVYLVKETKLHHRGALIALAAFVAVTAMASYFAYSRYWVEGSRVNISSPVSIRSVAVLPFANATGNPDTEYLSEGVSESLINALSQLPDVKVIARSSAFKYTAKEVDPREVANALGVDAIVTGRVDQHGDNLLISVELMNARDRTQVWGEQYNRKATDLLAVQTEISSEIARKLRLRLTTGEQQQLAKRETVNLQAYELLLKGRFSWSKGGTANRKAALEYYRQATAVDPTYALAYAEISGSYDSLITNNEIDPKEFTPEVEAAARKAVELDENLAEAHLAMAWVKISAWEWAAAELEIKRTLELNPNLVPAHNAYAVYLRIHGRREEAVAECNRARELDPLSPSANRAVINALGILRQNDQALEVAKRMLDQDKGNPNSHILVGQFYARLGRNREAIAAYQEAINLGDDSADAQILLGAAYARGGERDKARAILKQFETGKEYVSPVGLAVLHVALGERDQAFASLEAAYAAHDQQLIWLRGQWEFGQLESDQRFEDLVRRVGLN